MQLYLNLSAIDNSKLFLISNTVYYAIKYILICLFRVDLYLYAHCRKMLGEYCDIQIAIYDEMKDEIYFIFNF